MDEKIIKIGSRETPCVQGSADQPGEAGGNPRGCLQRTRSKQVRLFCQREEVDKGSEGMMKKRREGVGQDKALQAIRQEVSISQAVRLKPPASRRYRLFRARSRTASTT